MTFNILVKLDETTSKWFEVVACDLQAAIADIEQAYGEFKMVTYNVKN